jgi:hypothetical protein
MKTKTNTSKTAEEIAEYVRASADNGIPPELDPEELIYLAESFLHLVEANRRKLGRVIN